MYGLIVYVQYISKSYRCKYHHFYSLKELSFHILSFDTTWMKILENIINILFESMLCSYFTKNGQ